MSPKVLVTVVVPRETSSGLPPSTPMEYGVVSELLARVHATRSPAMSMLSWWSLPWLKPGIGRLADAGLATAPVPSGRIVR